MEEKRISKLIDDYKNGNIDALEQLWKQMLPLIKKHAWKTHFMEYDDACQEYSTALIEAINKIRIYDTDDQCLKYLTTCIKNKFCFLYKHYCTEVANEIFDDIIDTENATNTYDDIIFFADIANFIEKLPSETKRNIASLSILQQKSDAEIALQLGLSRQYINRIRKEIYRELSALYK